MAKKNNPYQRYFTVNDEGELVPVDQRPIVKDDGSIDYSNCNLVSCSHLGYNEKGEVIIIDEPSIDGWKEMEACAPGCTLKEIIVSATRSHGSAYLQAPIMHTNTAQYGDDSLLPDNIFDAIKIRDEHFKEVQDLGIVSGSSVDEITQKLIDNPDLIKDFVKSKMTIDNGGSNNG